MPQKKAHYDFDFDVSKMTPEEVKEKLKEGGIPFESWVHNEEEREVTTLPMFERKAELLKQLAGILEDQIENDVKEVDTLNVQLHRLKRGGGQ